MIRIVGRKIVMQKGDSGAFRVMLRDTKGNELPLSASDKITLRMKYAMEANSSFSKTANIVHIGDTYYHLIKFNSSDTTSLLEGDYHYDVILENENKRYTIIPTSVFTLEESMSLADLEDNTGDEVDYFDAADIDFDTIMAATPLVGIFSAIKYTGTSVDEEANMEIEDEEVELTALDDDFIVF